MWKVVEQHHHITEQIEIKFNYIPCDRSAKYHGAIEGLKKAVMDFNFKGTFEHYAAQRAKWRAQQLIAKEPLVAIPEPKFYEALRDGEYANRTVQYNEGPILDGHFSAKRLHSEHKVDVIQDEDAKKIMQEALFQLTELEKESISQRHGISDESLMEIGKRHGISHEYVRQIGIKTEQKLIKYFKNKGITKCTV